MTYYYFGCIWKTDIITSNLMVNVKVFNNHSVFLDIFRFVCVVTASLYVYTIIDIYIYIYILYTYMQNKQTIQIVESTRQINDIYLISTSEYSLFYSLDAIPLYTVFNQKHSWSSVESKGLFRIEIMKTESVRITKCWMQCQFDFWYRIFWFFTPIRCWSVSSVCSMHKSQNTKITCIYMVKKIG